MKKKLLLFIALFTALTIATLAVYPPLGCKTISKSAWNYLSSQGYSESDIELVRVEHNYISGFLGYGQWITEVVFKDEPYISYDCVVDGIILLRVIGLYAASIRADLPQDYIFMHETVN